MEKKSNSLDRNIASTIPIFLKYEVIQEYLRQKFTGEIISKEDAKGRESKYAKILDLSLSKSVAEGYDLAILIKLQTLTFLYRDRIVEVFIDASIKFEPKLQKISIEDFEIDSKGKSWLADQLLESVVNRFMYDKLKARLNFDLMPQIEEQISSLNLKLENKLQASEGIHVTGSLDQLEISNLEARDNGLWIFMTIGGWGVVEIEKIEF